MRRAAIAAMSIAAITSAALAQSTGIAFCDDFFKKYEACIAKVPEEVRERLQRNLNALRKMIGQDAALQDVDEGTCKVVAKNITPTLSKTYGCTF